MTLSGEGKCRAESGGAPLLAFGAPAAPDAPGAESGRRSAAAQPAATQTPDRRALFLREVMGDRHEEQENAAKDVDPDHRALREIRPQGGVLEQILQTLRERHEQDQKENQPPFPYDREDRDDDDDAHDPRIVPIQPEPRLEQIVHGLTPFGVGGNVWESNPPRTLETPDRRI